MNPAVVAGTEARPTKMFPATSDPPEKVPLILKDETEVRPMDAAGAKMPPKLEGDPPWRVTLLTVRNGKTVPKFVLKLGEGLLAEWANTPLAERALPLNKPIGALMNSVVPMKPLAIAWMFEKVALPMP